MFTQSFLEVYGKFRLHFYRAIFSRLGRREADLTTVETVCMEIIHALGRPTVNAFASFAGISPQNAAYKVGSLLQKGYVCKVRSTEDKREYYLQPTEKYYRDYDVSDQYVRTVVARLERRVSPEDKEAVVRVLRLMADELMPETPPLTRAARHARELPQAQGMR